MRQLSLFASLLFAAFVFCVVAPARGAESKPNVLVILIDDTGWAECGFQGLTKDIPTPHMDSIAKNGVRFTQGYVSGPYCSPTRAGLMTGRYQTRFGHEFNSVARQSGIPASETTIAQRMKELGYATCAIGKWHLGGGPQFRATAKGFDEFYGTVANTPFYHPPQFIDSRVSQEPSRVEDPNFYTTDAYGDRAVDFITKHKDKPWFVYLPFNAQHAPLQAPKKYLDRFQGIADEKRKTFAAMMSGMDDAIGKTLEAIRANGQEENTLIWFLADNGGPTQSTTSQNGPLRGFKSTTWEGGVRVPFCVQWKGKIPAGKTYDHPVIQLDILPTVLTAAGGKVDPAWKLDGVDLMPYLTGANTAKPHETLYWRFGEQWAVRHGDHKLLVGRMGSGQPELYDVAKDIGESKNLATEQPEKMKELQAVYDKWNAEQAPPSSAKEDPNQKNKKGKEKRKGKGKKAKQAE